VREAREVVEGIEQLLDEARLAARLGFEPLPRRALAIVVVLGSEAEVLVTLLSELTGGTVVVRRRGRGLDRLRVVGRRLVVELEGGVVGLLHGLAVRKKDSIGSLVKAGATDGPSRPAE
jgi:hypothetical protein